MIPLRTAFILLLLSVIAALGCAQLPSRDMEGPSGQLQLDPDPTQSGPAEAPRLPHLPETEPALLDSAAREAVTPPAPSIAQAKFDATSVAEMSAFIKELEAASHIDAATRNQILATALHTPVKQQAGLIRQYRAMLALGRSTTEQSPASTASPTSPPEYNALPDKPDPIARTEPVVPVSHVEPIQEENTAPLPKAERLSELEGQLQALLQEMKSGKVATAARAAASGESNDPTSREHDESDEPISVDATWEQLVDSAIEKLEERRDRRLDTDLREEDEARLRMLYLIADRRDDAVRTIASLEPEMQEFWSKQFFGLSTLLNSELIADRSNRLVESKRNFDEALRRLGEAAPLFVRNLAFITSVDSYGAYTPFEEYEFRPGKEVLLYAEVENYRSKETARGYHTALRSTFEIFDTNRQKVAEHEFSTNEEYCKNARRDFFTVCQFLIPEKLRPGKYVLRLTVADLNGDKAGESSITFHVRDDS